MFFMERVLNVGLSVPTQGCDGTREKVEEVNCKNPFTSNEKTS
jgi:hypothetical protein